MFINHLLWACLLALIFWRLELIALKFLEMKWHAQEAVPLTREPIPPDLLQEALDEQGGTWAKEQHVKWLREQYEELGSWDKVRQVMALT